MKLLGLFLIPLSIFTMTGCFGDKAEEAATGPSSLELATKALAVLDAMPESKTPFDPTGWETGERSRYGSPEAIRGGIIRLRVAEYPTSLCCAGPNSRSVVITRLNDMVSETLMGQDPLTEKFEPGLATHWKESDDHKTLWFKIDERARFSDGKEVTALDVIESFKLFSDKRIKAPWHNSTWPRRFDVPVAESKYIVRINQKESLWMNLLLFGSLRILPAHEIMSDDDHARFIKKFNWKFYSGSGPYKLDYTKRGRSVVMIRRDDWWGDKIPENKGLWNFKRIKFVVVKDEVLDYEKFKHGDIDVHSENISKRWATETNFDKINKGYILKRQIWTEKAQGIQGFALNQRTWPFDDKRVRLAMFYLYPRQTFIDRLFYGQYLHIDSLWPNSAYQSPKNVPIRYDPPKARKLLEEAGYTKRNEEGILVDKEGRALELSLNYSSKSSEKYYTVYKETLANAGIKLNMKLSTAATNFQLLQDHKFLISSASWNSPRPPGPESMLHSKKADVKNSTNVSGTKIPELDALIEEYDKEYDPDKRTALMKEIDHLGYSDIPYILDWYCPYVRILYWNKFSYPEFQAPISGASASDYWATYQYWWFDPVKEKALKEAMEKGTSLDKGELDNKFWVKYRETNGENLKELLKREWGDQ
jgi:microcin C transport system substrate-binding protein